MNNFQGQGSASAGMLFGASWRLKVMAPLLVLLGFLIAPMTAWASETITFLHHDHLGSPIAVTDTGGHVVSEHEYSAWGQAVENGSGDAPILGYTGHVSTPELPLVYAQARYYDPSLARFVSRDPVPSHIASPLTFNMYAYGANSPYVYVDPNGEQALALGIALGVVYLAATTGAFHDPNWHDGSSLSSDLSGAHLPPLTSAVLGPYSWLASDKSDNDGFAEDIAVSAATPPGNNGDDPNGKAPKKRKKASQSKPGDLIRTPDTHMSGFTRLKGGRFRNKATGEIWTRSNSAHYSATGEWKVGLKPGQVATDSRKVTVVPESRLAGRVQKIQGD
ncbi:MAG: RHS domain-containing protein [Alcanivoracaceae bacterium]|nr:RHS domain-containing protein [Alcanivoracaceae bacterium]